MSNPINIKKVAEMAGVSVASVSRTINGKGGVGEATRQKVLDTCRSLNYNPSITARKLSSGKDATVGILLSKNDSQLSPYVTLIYKQLLAQLKERGLVPEIVYEDKIRSLGDIASSCIVIGATKDDPRLPILDEMTIPFVAIGKQQQGWWVAPDEFMGIRQMTMELINRGKKRIAFVIAKDEEEVASNVRFQGYLSAVESVGLPEKAIVFEGKHFQGMHVCSHFYRHPEIFEQVDALVCNSDEIALGILEVLKHREIQIPNDIAVTGFDDLPLVSANLTTIRQNLDHIASNAMELLDKAKKQETPYGVVSPVEVVMRETS
ncbi:hypothetical protein RJ45_00940 [Photobacterium gaetbulicola]|uniref:HTH lacI-type domain-containing protein n=1 Tax=Photobacterium gaetbulicola TaxID=1295392 RepID=A0A0B9H3H4_9GAMM|nr:LacI family DNA-binding transcriptional regulator [Photobacterium gaetbulicola]KHT65466.1 hypothetical protein RJ45_00940 [Photobacterium gaetbulicola]